MGAICNHLIYSYFPLYFLFRNDILEKFNDDLGFGKDVVALIHPRSRSLTNKASDLVIIDEWVFEIERNLEPIGAF